jgi:hypothetical protein
MALLTAALDTNFTPAVGDFLIQVTGGSVQLVRRNSAGAAWALVQSVTNQALVVSNPVAGADYKFTATQIPTTAVVQADQ